MLERGSTLLGRTSSRRFVLRAGSGCTRPIWGIAIFLGVGILNVTTDPSEPLATDDVVGTIWEQTCRVPASRGDHLLDVLVNESGMARSMQVSALFRDIATATGVHLPVSIALQSPSAADLAKMVRHRHWPAHDRPVLMRPGAADQSLFYLPGIGGIGLDALGLVKHLSFPGPIYLNPPRGLDGAEPHRTLKALVADHVALIRAIQPHGPYWLLGYSWGGLVALEIARCLQGSQEQVAFLGMIDTVLNQSDWTYGAWLQYVGARISHHLSAMRQTGSPSAAFRYGQGLLVPVFDKIVRPFGINKFWPLESPGQGLSAALSTLWTAESEIIKTYRLSYYDGSVTFFAMQGGNAGEVDPREVWLSKVARFELQWLPGDHSLIEPQVGDAGQLISATLQAYRL